jgi:hypothetical protein
VYRAAAGTCRSGASSGERACPDECNRDVRTVAIIEHFMTKVFNVATYVLLGWGSLLAQAQNHNSAECVSQGAAIYTVGEDHVKPPKIHIVHSERERLPATTSSVICEVLINSEGRICDIRIIKAPDRQTARQVGMYIGENLRFSAATREGKSVAAKVPIVFDSSGKFTTPQ